MTIEACEMVHESVDEWGLVQVVRAESLLSLQFGTEIQQSCLDLCQPRRLVFEYLRGMALSAGLIPPDPAVLVLGLGGGSLPTFLHDRFPGLSIHAVEARASVIHVAHQFFHLPKTPQLQITHQDALSFVRQCRQSYRHIFIDLYDEYGMCPSARRLDFLDQCRCLLLSPGMLTVNVWTSDTHGARWVYDTLSQGFPNRVMTMKLPSGRNQVFFAWNGGAGGSNPFRPLEQCLKTFRTWNDDYVLLLKQLIQGHPHWLEHDGH